MSHQPHDGSAEDGLCGSLLRFVDDGQVEPLRQVLSGFNHRCRNMLNSMKMGFYLAKRSATAPMPARWDELNRTYTEIERLFDLLQAIYRKMSLTLVRQPFQAIVHERSAVWSSTFEREGLTLTILPPENEDLGEFDAMRLSSALDGFLAWRASRMPAGSAATLSWSTVDRQFQIHWRETKPAAGLSPPVVDRSAPDVALAATASSLSLPLLARVVAEHQGRLSWTTSPSVAVVLSWPLTLVRSTEIESSSPVSISHPNLAPSLG